MICDLEISIFSPWHAGSGRGDGPLSDALSVRDASGLPYLPGKTLKGLLRDGLYSVESLGRCAEGITNSIFGASQHEGEDGMKRFGGVEGRVIISDATLCPPADLAPLRQWAVTHPAEVSALFTQISSTSLDQEMSVKEGSLRTIEFVRSVALYATIEGIDETDVEAIRIALPLIRGLGLRRSRGFGACRLKMEVRS